MLVTFKSSSFSNITMFGDVAEKLLKMMGQSGNVPGALLAEDVQPALSALRDALGQAEEEEPPQPLGDDNDASAAHVAIHVRAKPLIDLLTAAASDNEAVTWES